MLAMGQHLDDLAERCVVEMKMIFPELIFAANQWQIGNFLVVFCSVLLCSAYKFIFMQIKLIFT